MDLKEFIFTPLDLPDPPQVDQADLLDYCDEWRRHCFFEKRVNYITSTNTYPWYPPVQPLRPKLDLSLKEINLREEFKTRFKDFYEYANTQFPFKLQAITILIQKEDIAVTGHTDADEEWAFRFYLWNNFENDALWFRKPKDPRRKIIPNTLLTDYREFEDPAYARFPKKSYIPWAFNSHRTIHGVDKGVSENPSRCAVIIRGAIYKDKMTELLERSSEKYREFVI